MRFFVLLYLICTTAVLFAQDRYVIQIKDKNNSPFSLSNPSAFLSVKSIQRRNNQGIAIDSADLPVNPAYISQISATGAAILGRSKWLNTVTIQASNPAVLASINALPFVQSVENVGRISHGSGTGRNKFSDEKLFAEKSILNSDNYKKTSFNYGLSLNQISMIGGDIMHNNGYTGNGKTIAVIDAGFFNADNMDAFDSLFATGKILGTWDFTDDNSNVFDDANHGSHVLSIMGGNWPGNIVGTAPHASYWLLRSEYGPAEYIIEEYDWAEAAEFADSVGADIINSSLGYTEFDDPAQNHTYADMNGDATPVTRAADFAAQKGMVVCNSAGNSGNGPWYFIGAPADADSILTIGGVDDMGNYVSFSSKGPTSDGRIKPDLAAQAFGTYVADVNNGGVFPGSGTSFSCPIIAGAAACLWQCHPASTAMQIMQALRQSASQFSNPDSFLGYGIPDLPQACLILSSSYNFHEHHGNNLFLTGPNPFYNELKFAFFPDNSHFVQILMIDFTGKIVFSKNLNVDHHNMVNHYSINEPLSSGMYLLILKTENGLLTKKVIRQ